MSKKALKQLIGPLTLVSLAEIHPRPNVPESVMTDLILLKSDTDNWPRVQRLLRALNHPLATMLADG